MSQSDGFEEFLNAVGGEDATKPKTTPIAKSLRDLFNEISSDEDSVSDEDPPPGQCEQYSIFGPGYVPTTKTIAKLEPGVYKILVFPSATIFAPQRVVTDSLLRLPDSKSDEVISEIENFWSLRKKFGKYGFSHKRGILLWGPPGSGKTCTIAIILKQMVDAGGLCVLSNDIHPSILADMLHKLRQVEKHRPVVVVIEDIDTMVARHGESEVLSLLDGEYQIDNVVYLATTNYPEKLDGRLVNRPSRFDRIVKIDTPNEAARLAYLQSRNLEISDDEMRRWARETRGFSIAHLRELIVGTMCLGHSFDEEMARLKGMFQTPKSDDSGRKTGFGANNGF